MIYYIRPSAKITSSRIRNTIWRVINEGCLPPQHDQKDVFVDVTQEELNKVMDALLAHPRLRTHKDLGRCR